MQNQPAPNAPLPAAADGVNPAPGLLRRRLDGIDCLRGVVMVIMALDHTRDYLGTGTGLPRDVHDPVLFLTRWITNFCAPTFVLLAGLGGYLYGRRVSSKAQLAKFLLTRGLWLVVAELTVVHLGWSFSLQPDLILLQVIWAIGWAMVVLSGLVFLPEAVLGATALGLIFGHNLLDAVSADSWGRFKEVWLLLHQPGMFQLGPHSNVLAVYPLLPWIGVLILGYACGPLMPLEPGLRRKRLLVLGGLWVAVFLVLRVANRYGDPRPWAAQSGAFASLLSFVNCEKYPPSLLFLAMTLGPALLTLALLGDQAKSRCARFFVAYGRVPFFYYLAHIYLIHLVAVVVVLAQHGDVGWMLRGLPPLAKPEGWGFNLPAVYLLWMLIVWMLYLPCRWYGRIKQTRRDWWLSYL